jgi:hypothetical protein
MEKHFWLMIGSVPSVIEAKLQLVALACSAAVAAPLLRSSTTGKFGMFN